MGRSYAGRASAAPVIDLLVTLLSMGLNGYRTLLHRRGILVGKFRRRLSKIARAHGERILTCPGNTVSFGMTLDALAGSDKRSCAEDDEVDTSHRDRNELNEERKEKDKESLLLLHRHTTLLGSMLFSRCISGTRVVPGFSSGNVTDIGRKEICGLSFSGYGSSTDRYQHSYLTAACAIGMGGFEMEDFFVRLDRCLREFGALEPKGVEK